MVFYIKQTCSGRHWGKEHELYLAMPLAMFATVLQISFWKTEYRKVPLLHLAQYFLPWLAVVLKGFGQEIFPALSGGARDPTWDLLHAE